MINPSKKPFAQGKIVPLASLLCLWIIIFIAGSLLTKRSTPELLGQIPAAPTTQPAAMRRRRRRQEPLDASASYGRYSTELQDDTSIDQQQQNCRQYAEREGHAIAPELEFADQAVSGTKRFRQGLDALLDAAERGRFRNLYFYSLSRLARESVIGMPILKRLVYVYHVRVVSVTEGLDSSREGWETLAQILLMQHERYVKELGNNTFRGQEGIARDKERKFSIGDYCFGFTGVPVAGSEATRRGRHARPRMTYQIEPVAAGWVRRIFDWFVRERRSLRWITQELNRLGAPKDHRATTKLWHHTYLPRLLQNRKYIGIWPWGKMKNVRDPETGDVSQEPRPEDETQAWERHFPELRIIDDATFAAAERLLAENAARHAHRHKDDNGTFSPDQHDAAAGSPQHLLSGLVQCGHCRRLFNVGGAYGKYLFCRGYQIGDCPCQTTLRRDRAERLILAAIGTRILADPQWGQTVFDHTLAAWHRLQDSLPNELRDTESALVEVIRKINRLVDQVEGTDQPDPDLRERLAQRRAERRELEDKLKVLRQKADHTPPEPTFEWVRQKLTDLHEVLASPTPAANFTVRDLIGGPIRVEEVRQEGRKRFHLRGSFGIQIGRLVQLLGVQAEQQEQDVLAEEVTIDFVDENPLDAKAEEAKALRDAGLLHQEIAKQMNCWPSCVTKYLKHWERLHGQPLPPKRQKQDRQLCQHQQIADEVMPRVENGELLQDIAVALDVDRNVITAAIRWWHEQRGLPVPDGRSRRKQLLKKTSRSRRSNPQPPASDTAA